MRRAHPGEERALRRASSGTGRWSRRAPGRRPCRGAGARPAGRRSSPSSSRRRSPRSRPSTSISARHVVRAVDQRELLALDALPVPAQVEGDHPEPPRQRLDRRVPGQQPGAAQRVQQHDRGRLRAGPGVSVTYVDPRPGSSTIRPWGIRAYGRYDPVDAARGRAGSRDLGPPSVGRTRYSFARGDQTASRRMDADATGRRPSRWRRSARCWPTCLDDADGELGRSCAEAGLLGLAVPEALRRRGARAGRGRGAAPRDRRPRDAAAGLGDALLRRPDPRRGTAPTSSSRRCCRASPAGDAAADAGAPRGRPADQRDAPTTTYADGTVTGRKIGVTYADRATPAAGHRRCTATSRSSRWSTSATPASPCSSPAPAPRITDAHGRPRRRPGRAPRRRRRAGAGRALRRRPLPHRGRRRRRRPRPHRGATSRAAPSSAGRWPSSRRSRCRSPTSTSPRAPSTSPPRTPPGGSTRGST